MIFQRWRGALSNVFPGFVKVLNTRFVDKRTGIVAYFDGVAVVPLDVAFQFFSIFENETHECLGLHLFLKVEGFSVGTFVSSGSEGVIRERLVRQQRGLIVTVGVTLCSTLRNWRSDQFAWACSNDMHITGD